MNEHLLKGLLIEAEARRIELNKHIKDHIDKRIGTITHKHMGKDEPEEVAWAKKELEALEEMISGIKAYSGTVYG